MPGGWAARSQHVPCRWCGAEVPKGRRTFCGPECVHQWRLRTDPGYLRAQVFARDRGVCAACGLDTEALRKDKRKLDYRARRQFEKDWGGRRNLWDADHILPVAEGGGECDLSNMRTLCLKCHRDATAALRARQRAKGNSGSGDAPGSAEVVMAGKKAHQPRIVEGAGMHGVHAKPHRRKSEGETTGQYTRDPKGRRGQYGGAGSAPLVKK